MLTLPLLLLTVQALERLFVSHGELWSSAIEAVAVLDCLMALAGAAQAADGKMCRPKLLPPGPEGERLGALSGNLGGVVGSRVGRCMLLW